VRRDKVRWLHLSLSVAAIAFVLAAPAAAAGAEHEEHHGPSTRETILQAINLLILLAVLIYAARKPIQAYFATRREQIRKQLDGASDFLKQAEGRFAEWQRKLAQLDSELEQIRATARRRAQEERDQILADARAAAERIRQDAQTAIGQELRRAQDSLRREAGDLAVEFAARILSEQIRAEDRDRLVDEFISGVESRGSASTGGTH
jgi:F-type H+-transporting ATPase subunit b